MEKYVKPDITVEEYKPVDVITTSAGDSGSSGEPTTRPNSTPYIPIP